MICTLLLIKDMLKVGLCGCNGVMGRVVDNVISKMDDVEIVFGIDRSVDKFENEYKVYEKAEQVDVSCDVIIDFSNPSNLYGLLNLCVAKKIPVVIATTGLTERQEENIMEASKYVPIFKSSNTSLGVNVLIDLVKKATSILGSDFDIEIVEKHHNKKMDAPSGTARMIANAVNEEMDNAIEFKYGREGGDCKRQPKEVGIHAIRGGTIPGEHTVIFAGMDEIVEIKHEALSKSIFAKGAVDAAKFMVDKEVGLYNMNDLINK